MDEWKGEKVHVKVVKWIAYNNQNETEYVFTYEISSDDAEEKSLG